MECVFPGTEWTRLAPEEAGFSAARLAGAERWLHHVAGDQPFRLVIARYGYLLAEWTRRIEPDAKIRLHSASKSVYSLLLGVAVAEGRLPSIDARVVEHYPEMMEVAQGEGPKPGRHAFPANAGITFRQLIGNTSGYMKPGEAPGRRFHYQTFGMNVLPTRSPRSTGCTTAPIRRACRAARGCWRKRSGTRSRAAGSMSTPTSTSRRGRAPKERSTAMAWTSSRTHAMPPGSGIYG